MMLAIPVPGAKDLRLEHLVLDFNGTLARDGMLIAGVRPRLERLAEALRVHVITGDTFGRAREAVSGLPCELVILQAANQAQAKLEYVRQLGPRQTACVGNGRNDVLMMGTCTLSIAVVQAEGAWSKTLTKADVVVGRICDGLDLLLNPLRLAATLRN
jgi:soluble P-type ATPase